jgi:5-methylthioadenosine/S-adenosylhomocysteine deaminase
MEDQIGSVQEGKKADLILLNLKHPHLTPPHNLISHMVYAARGSDVSTTIVNGNPLMIDHQFLTVDFEKTIHDAEQCAQELIN